MSATLAELIHQALQTQVPQRRFARLWRHEFFTTPTFAALNVRPLSVKPFCVV